jgi:hypothetical protein
VGGGNRVVVCDDRDDVNDVIDEGLTIGAVGVIGEVDSDQELSEGNGRDRHVVVIGDQVVECRS